MGINEDREDFNSTGLRGLLNRLRKQKEEGFIRITQGGWQGEEVAERPEPGTGPYLHFKLGDWTYEYPNEFPADDRRQRFKDLL